MENSMFKRFTAFITSCYDWDTAFLKRVLVITVPIIAQELIASSLHIIDGLMVSGLGDTAYAAVVQANRYSFLFQLCCFGVASGGAIFMSQFWGANDVKRMRQSLGVSLLWMSVLTSVFIAAALFLTDPIISLFLAEGESAEISKVYLRWVSLSYMFQGVTMIYAACMKSGEKTHIPLISSSVGIALNTFLNYCLIYGHFGLPAMGAKGAALATVIASAVTLILTLSFAYGLRLPAGASFKQMVSRDKGFLVRYAKTTIPVVLNEGLWALGMTMYGVYYGHMGDTAVAAMGIVSTVDNLLWVFLFSMMHATAIIVGKEIGAGKSAIAYLYAKRLIAAGMLLGAVLGLILALIRHPMLSLFTGLSDTVIETAAVILLIESFTIWFRAFNTINVVGVLRSGGDTVFSLKLDVGSLWIIGVPLCALATYVLNWPLIYVYVCTMSEEIVKVALGIPHFRKRQWIKNLTNDKGDLVLENH